MTIKPPQKKHDQVDYQIDLLRNGESDLILLGDTSHGDNYQLRAEQFGQENILKTQGYQYSFEPCSDLLRQAGIVMANLETPITDLANSPYEHIKDYVHHTDVISTPHCLKHNNISAVSLANNHTIDFGETGLLQTIDVLTQNNIKYFGAGNNLAESGQPCIIKLTHQQSSKKLIILSAYQFRKNYQRKYKAYADDNSPGIQPLAKESIASWIQKIRSEHPDAFILLFPHWGSNYEWVSYKQLVLAENTIQAGADMIIGHGAHMMQHICRMHDTWIAYSLGNFVFNSKGRYKSFPSITSVSLIARLMLNHQFGRFTLTPRFYPIQSDNQLTGFQPRFLTDAEFDAFHQFMLKLYPLGDVPFKQLNCHQDQWGHFIETPSLLL